MSAPLPLLIFVIAALAVIVGQVMILRSTARAWEGTKSPVPFVERLFAWGPVPVVAAILWFSWRAMGAP